MLTDVRGLINSYDGDLPAANWTLGYEQDQDGLEPINWMPSSIQSSLPDGLTRYVAGGGAISAPSENLRFYFSGIYAPSWGTIPDGQSAANALITVRMPTRQRPRQIQCRTGLDPSLSQSGVLIAIGGVHYSDALNLNLTAEQAVLSNQTSPTFMQTNCTIYDVANNQWYMQQTSGDIPPQLTLFCSVMAAAADGGYDGIRSSRSTSDDVYVLSIPSFTWVKVYAGTSTHGRNGHKCLKVHLDQMFVLGGLHDREYIGVCLEGGIVQVFNLNTLKFQDSYSLTTWSGYNVPSLVTAQIGGK
ncbi:hypothetical protein V8E54_001125 [Elaphomyces granulatus]